MDKSSGSKQNPKGQKVCKMENPPKLHVHVTSESSENDCEIVSVTQLDALPSSTALPKESVTSPLNVAPSTSAAVKPAAAAVKPAAAAVKPAAVASSGRVTRSKATGGMSKPKAKSKSRSNRPPPFAAEYLAKHFREQKAAGKVNARKPPNRNFFESSLGHLLMDIGEGLVQENVQSDMLRSEKQKLRHCTGEDKQKVENNINTLNMNLQQHAEKNAPYKLKMKTCEFCPFKSESAIVLATHYETPHMIGNKFKCNYCNYSIRSHNTMTQHMWTMHGIAARIEKPLSNNQCPNCPYEDNGKARLMRHLPGCTKRFNEATNLAPPFDWSPPAIIKSEMPMTVNRPQTTADLYYRMYEEAAATVNDLATMKKQQDEQLQRMQRQNDLLRISNQQQEANAMNFLKSATVAKAQQGASAFNFLKPATVTKAQQEAKPATVTKDQYEANAMNFLKPATVTKAQQVAKPATVTKDQYEANALNSLKPATITKAQYEANALNSLKPATITKAQYEANVLNSLKPATITKAQYEANVLNSLKPATITKAQYEANALNSLKPATVTQAQFEANALNSLKPATVTKEQQPVAGMPKTKMSMLGQDLMNAVGLNVPLATKQSRTSTVTTSTVTSTITKPINTDPKTFANLTASTFANSFDETYLKTMANTYDSANMSAYSQLYAQNFAQNNNTSFIDYNHPSSLAARNVPKMPLILCEICSTRLQTMENLAKHMHLVHNIQIDVNAPLPISCVKCSKRFHSEKGLERHLLCLHGIVTNNLEAAAMINKDRGRCLLCSDNLLESSFIAHVKNKHLLRLKVANLYYTCPVCKERLLNLNDFQQHVKNKHPEDSSESDDDDDNDDDDKENAPGDHKKGEENKAAEEKKE